MAMQFEFYKNSQPVLLERYEKPYIEIGYIVEIYPIKY